jgi:hypothetical protein
MEDLQMDSNQKPEEEGETRVRVVFSSKIWFGVEARLNGQLHYL